MIVPYQTELEYELPRKSIATPILIAINVVIFTFTRTLAYDELQLFFLNWGFNRFEFSLISLFTAMFLHADIFHLAGNMISLHIYGVGVEAGYGPVRFTLYYIVFGALGSFLHAALSGANAVDVPLVGASGAIAGVMGAFFVMHPRASVKHFVIILPQIRFSLPAWVVLGEWFLSQIFSAQNESGSNIAFFAHVGGFAAGFVATTYLKYGGDFRRAVARTEAHKTIDAASHLPRNVNPRLGLDLLKAELEKSPGDANLRYWCAIMARRADRQDFAKEMADSVLPCVLVENKPARLNGYLLRANLIGPVEVAANVGEFSGLLAARKRYAEAEEILRLFLEAHPDTDLSGTASSGTGLPGTDKRETLTLRYKRAELMARHLGREAEALAIFDEVALGPKNDPLVQGAQFEAKGIRHKMDT